MNISRKDEETTGTEKPGKKTIRKMTVRIGSCPGKEQIISKILKKEEIKDVSN